MESVNSDGDRPETGLSRSDKVLHCLQSTDVPQTTSCHKQLVFSAEKRLDNTDRMRH